MLYYTQIHPYTLILTCTTRHLVYKIPKNIGMYKLQSSHTPTCMFLHKHRFM